MTEITNDHLKLLEKAHWDYVECEYGAPAINCKRPYGNGNVEEDIAEILGWRLFENRYGETELSPEQSDRAYELHHELTEVIQEIIKTYTDTWRKAKGIK